MRFTKSIILALSLIASASALPSSQVQQRDGTTNTGEATFYNPGLGECGFFNSASDLVVAVSVPLFETTPGVCGKQITATFQGRSVTATVVDVCPTCQGLDGLDFSPAAFSALAPLSLGIINVDWVFD